MIQLTFVHFCLLFHLRVKLWVFLMFVDVHWWIFVVVIICIILKKQINFIA